MNARTDLIGEVPDMPAAEYHALDAMSNSALTQLAKSPFHWWSNYRAPNRPVRVATAAMKAGTLAHTAVLEPGTLAQRYAVKPAGLDGRAKEGKDWILSHAGLEVITEDQFDTAKAQRAAVMACPDLASILSTGRAESSVFWIDAATGLHCKARPDWLHELPDGRLIVLDLKTTADESPDGFARSVAQYGYHRQQAHYTAGIEAATGREVAAFMFAAVSGSYPFVAVPYILSDDAAAQGFEEVAELLALYAECSRTDTWPAYGTGPQLLSLPKWAQRTTEIEVAYV